MRIVDDPAIQILPEAYVESPTANRNRVLEVEREFLNVRVAAEGEKAPSACQVEGEQLCARGVDWFVGCFVEAGVAICIFERRKEPRISDSEVERSVRNVC